MMLFSGVHHQRISNQCYTLNFGIGLWKVWDNEPFGNRIERETYFENTYVLKYCST